MSKTVAVTGATGFIGKHIVADLLAQGFSVRSLTRKKRGNPEGRVIWVQGALEDQDTLTELVHGADYVVHCAGQVRGHNQDVFTRCNVDGSLRLMQAAKKSGTCTRFLFMSSLAAREPDLSWYARSKHDAEKQLMALDPGAISLGIFRPTAVYGPGDKEMKPVFDWLLRGLLPRLGAEQAQLSFLHVSDLAQAVSQWLISKPHDTLPYELCDGIPGYSWKQLQKIGSQVRNGRVRLIGIPLPLLERIATISTVISRLTGKEPMLTRSKIGELTHNDWSANNERLTAHINWLPKVSLERALRERLF